MNHHHHHHQQQQLLREYVRRVLVTEDDGGYGGLAGAAADLSPYGAHYASSSDLYKTFIKPFVDVAEVTAGKAKETSQRAQTVVKVAFETIATTLLPFLKDSYGKIFAKEKQAIDKIKSEYGEVYKATWDAFKTNDVAWTAFIAFPGPVMAGRLALNAPDIALRMISVISGGSMDPYVGKVKEKFKGTAFLTGMKGHDTHIERGSHGNKSNLSDVANEKLPSSFGESVLREDSDSDDSGDKKSSKKERLAGIVTDPKVIKKALSSPEAQRLQKAAQETVKKTLSGVFKQASAVAGAKSLEELQREFGKPLPGMDKLRGLKPKERQSAETQLLSGLRKSLKEFYAKSLEAQAKQASDGGIPDDSPYIKMYRDTARKIRALLC